MSKKQAFWRDPVGMYGSFTCSACGGASGAKTLYCRRCGARMENAVKISPPASDPPRREIIVTANVGGKSVNISYDPHDPEAAKAAETWRKALFAELPKDALDAVFEQIRREGYCCPSHCDGLRRAAEPLRDYLKTHGDPHTSVIVTQDGATEAQDERRVKFEGGAT